MKGNTKDQFSTHLKNKLGEGNLPQGFDQRFLSKLNEEKIPRTTKPQKKSRLWDELVSLIAPLGLATVLACLIIISTRVTIPTQRDWKARTEVLTKIQTHEVMALSTLSEKEWDYLIGSAD